MPEQNLLVLYETDGYMFGLGRDQPGDYYGLRGWGGILDITVPLGYYTKSIRMTWRKYYTVYTRVVSKW